MWALQQGRDMYQCEENIATQKKDQYSYGNSDLSMMIESEKGRDLRIATVSVPLVNLMINNCSGICVDHNE